MLTKAERMEDFKEVTEAEMNRLLVSDAAFVRPPQIFIDMWNTACGKWGRYNEATGFFELNGLTDITYEEALEIYDAGAISSSNSRELYMSRGIRTNLPLKPVPESGTLFDLTRFIYQCHKLEVLCLAPRVGSENSIITLANPVGLSFIQGAAKLTKVLGILDVSNVTAAFSHRVAYEVPNLTTIRLKNIKVDFNLRYLPKLDVESFNYMVDNRSGTNIITVTVHADIYAKLTGDTSNAAAAALSEEEMAQWMALLRDAAEKDIQFAAA